MILSKIVRVEQEEADTEKTERILNKELEKLQKEGAKVTNIHIAVGRDADISAGLKKRYSVTFVILYNQ